MSSSLFNSTSSNELAAAFFQVERYDVLEDNQARMEEDIHRAEDSALAKGLDLSELNRVEVKCSGVYYSVQSSYWVVACIVLECLAQLLSCVFRWQTVKKPSP